MSAIHRGAALAVAAAVSAAFFIGLVAGPIWGWANLAVLLALLVIYHVRHLARLERWLAEPQPGRVPEGSGSWDRVLSALHRYERNAAGRQSELAEALARFRRAAQAMPDGVVLLDAHRGIIWCNDNAAALLELDPRADIGRPIANLVRAPAFVDYLAAREAERPRFMQVPGPRGGTLAIQLIPYGEQQTLLLARDVTQVERLEGMRRDFVANVSHELRTPLTVLVGFLETVRELKLDAQRQQDYLGMMSDQAARMQRIIDDLLALSVLESAPAPGAERIRVAPLLERLRSDALALSTGRHAISLEGAPSVDLLGSESEIASALGNLVSNAVRYTPAGGSVKLVWREDPQEATFAVEDTGPGIAAEHIPRLTERFYRVDRSRSRETGGTGLGLAIVKHALSRHQAKLEIESSIGRGSRFMARFPQQRIVAIGVQTPSLKSQLRPER